jgi:hypothetical protein
MLSSNRSLKLRGHLSLAVVILVIALISGGCSDQEDPAITTQLVPILRELGGKDFEAHDSPAALAKDASLTIVGTVESVKDGRVFGAGPTRADEPVFFNATFAIRVETVVSSKVDIQEGEIIYMEIARSKETPVEEIRDATAEGQRVILFLDDYTEGIETFPIIEAGGIPDGATIYAPYADGLLVEDIKSGALVGGFEPLEKMPTNWQKKTESVKEFLTTNFPNATPP